MIGRRVLAAGVAVAAVAAGGIFGAVIGIPGLSGASSSSSLSAKAESSTGGNAGRHARGFLRPGMGASEDVLAAAAKALHLSTSDLLQKLSDGKTTIADVAKDQKADLQTVIDAMDAVAKSDVSNIVNNPFPMRPRFPGGAFGGLKGGSGASGGSGAVGPAFTGSGRPTIGGLGLGLGFGMRGAVGGSIDAVAKALGITTQDLVNDLRNGQSISDIAKAKNVDVGKLIDTLVGDSKSKIDAAVKAGHLPQAVATKLEANLKQMITNAVDNSGPKGFAGFGGARRGGRHGGYGPGPMMPAPAAPTAPPSQTN